MTEPKNTPVNELKPAGSKPEWKPNRILLLALAAACALVATLAVERSQGQTTTMIPMLKPPIAPIGPLPHGTQVIQGNGGSPTAVPGESTFIPGHASNLIKVIEHNG